MYSGIRKCGIWSGKFAICSKLSDRKQGTFFRRDSSSYGGAPRPSLRMSNHATKTFLRFGSLASNKGRKRPYSGCTYADEETWFRHNRLEIAEDPLKAIQVQALIEGDTLYLLFPGQEPSCFNWFAKNHSPPSTLPEAPSSRDSSRKAFVLFPRRPGTIQLSAGY